MITKKNQILDINDIKLFAEKLSRNLKLGDLVMLQGELGVGKTTFARSIINHLHILSKLKEPKSINSPTYPILLTYEVGHYEIYHYDFYRIKDIKELIDLDIFDKIKDSITLIEWPELFLNLSFNQKYYLINLEFYSETERIINIKYSE